MTVPSFDASVADITLRPAASAFFQLALPALLGDDHVYAGVAQVEGMRMSLAAVADDCYGLVLQKAQVAIFFVKSLRHSNLHS